MKPCSPAGTDDEDETLGDEFSDGTQSEDHGESDNDEEDEDRSDTDVMETDADEHSEHTDDDEGENEIEVVSEDGE